MSKDSFFTTCSNCSKCMHIAGCVSKKCKIDSIKSEMESLRNRMEKLQKALIEAEQEEDE